MAQKQKQEIQCKSEIFNKEVEETEEERQAHEKENQNKSDALSSKALLVLIFCFADERFFSRILNLKFDIIWVREESNLTNNNLLKWLPILSDRCIFIVVVYYFCKIKFV